MNQPSLSSLTVRELLRAVADQTSAPGGGASAAMTAALAAALTAMAGRFSTVQDPAGAPAAVQTAEALSTRAAALADADVAAYGEYLAARRRERDTDSTARETQEALSRAVDVPLEVSTLATQVAELAANLVRDGNPNLRGDAVTAVLLAAAASVAAADLVRANLTATPDDPRGPRAAAAAERARTLADLCRPR